MLCSIRSQENRLCLIHYIFLPTQCCAHMDRLSSHRSGSEKQNPTPIPPQALQPPILVRLQTLREERILTVYSGSTHFAAARVSSISSYIVRGRVLKDFVPCVGSQLESLGLYQLQNGVVNVRSARFSNTSFCFKAVWTWLRRITSSLGITNSKTRIQLG
jgi:hypothetical protein